MATGGLLKRLESIAKLGKTGVSVGLQGKGGVKGRSTDAELVNIARFNEYGLGVPERPAIRSAYYQHGHKWAKGAARAARFVARGDLPGAEKAYKQLGVVMVRDTQKSITSGGWVANAKSVRKRKGPGKPPLIDTGQMHDSVRAARDLGDGSKVLL